MGTYRNIFPVDSDVYVKPNAASTEIRVISNTGKLFDVGVPLHYLETITLTSVGLSVSTTPAYGVTYVNHNSTGGAASTSPQTLAIAAPIAGVKKTVILDTTAANANLLDLQLSGATIIGTSGDSFIAFSSLATATQSITLIGITTALWGVESVNSTLLFYGAATGIRGATAARTS